MRLSLAKPIDDRPLSRQKHVELPGRTSPPRLAAWRRHLGDGENDAGDERGLRRLPGPDNRREGMLSTSLRVQTKKRHSREDVSMEQR